ncbi:MAG TPA: DUF2225 domain-containing protein [Chloroflexota bacterium]|nr:DUF2225 domain-containing protein [Chloroflexota bacterium]
MPRRDVDFVFLRGLPGRRVVTAQPGETLLRSGDPGSDLHVVVSGRVRLVRGGATVAELGAGELFGELALLAGGGHPYEAIAQAATTMIAIPAAAALGAIGQSARFAQGLAQTAADRALQLAAAGPSPAGTADVLDVSPADTAPSTSATDAPGETGRPGAGLLLGDALAVPPWEAAKQAAKAAAEGKPSIDKAVPRPEAFWKKSYKCPLCDFPFQMLQVRDQFVEVASRDSDLYERHRGINTLHYAVVVCPHCYFAALPDDFGRLFANEREAIERALAPIRSRVGHVDFSDREYRTAQHAQASFELAIISYSQRRNAYRKVAGLYHRLGWLARAAGQDELERRHLAVARDGYVSALERREAEDPRIELTVMYLVADVSRRIGDAAEASKWVGQVLQHPQVERHKMIAELARELHQELRAARRVS